MYLRGPGVHGADGQQRVSVGGHLAAALQGLGLDGAAVHVERGVAVAHAQRHLVPAQVPQGLHALAGEHAAGVRLVRPAHAPRPQRQRALGSVEVQGELGEEAGRELKWHGGEWGGMGVVGVVRLLGSCWWGRLGLRSGWESREKERQKRIR